MSLPNFELTMDKVESILQEKFRKMAKITQDKDVPVPDGFKRCSVCEQVFVKSVDNFYRRTRAKDGLDYRCKDCSNSYKKQVEENVKRRKVQNGQME